MCSIYFLKLQCWAPHSCFLGLYFSHYPNILWTRIWVASAAGCWLQGPNCNVLAMYPVYSEIGPCHRRDVAWMVSITSGNGRPGPVEDGEVCFAIVWRGNVLMTPLAWEYWGPPKHPRMRVSWILMTLVVFLMLLCFCSMVFCVLTCLSSFLSRWRRRSQSYNSHRRNFVGDKEPNAFKTQVHHDPSDPCMV